ncbi:MAG: ATP-binding protein, partial [Candidatus Dormibacteraeota bacterium]|nr:ATP-binding protein [Candidatus Dormibacteraeota bacterium]
IGRFPPELEAAVYFCCLEALQNAGKYAGEGATATLRITQTGDTLVFEVTDSGAGFEPTARPGGAGMTNMMDRVGAVGGTLRVDSSLGRGTTVSGAIPLRTGAAAAAAAEEGSPASI